MGVDELLKEKQERDHYCTRCGRKMELVTELSRRRDPDTGQRVVERWIQCPRYPRNSFVYMIRGNHDSTSYDSLLTGREYR